MKKKPKINPASKLTDGELLIELQWRILTGQIPLYAENYDKGKYIEGIGYKDDWGVEGAMDLTKLREILELAKKDSISYQELVNVWWESNELDYDKLIKQLKSRKKRNYSNLKSELEPYYPRSKKKISLKFSLQNCWLCW